MKIAIWHNLPSGGGKRALYYHVKGLLERGHHLESWTSPKANQKYLPLKELITENIVELNNEQDNKPLIRPPAEYRQVIRLLKMMNEHAQQCAEEINQGNFDVLLANSCQYLYNNFLGRYVTIPKVLYLQEPHRLLQEASPEPPWKALPEFQNKWSYSLWKEYIRDIFHMQAKRIQVREEWLNAQAFDLILANSLFSRESINKAYGIDSKVCYLGIDTQLFCPLEEIAKERFIVGLGSFTMNKGIEQSIAAIGTIPLEKRPPLVWVGNSAGVSYNYQQAMKKLAISLKVDLVFKEFIPDEELVKILNRATVLLYTSRLEPFGFAPLEANACGIPVIAIAEGGVRETIKDGVNGILINDNDPLVIGQAILKLLDNPDLAQEMGKKAREYVIESWSWNQAIDRLERYLFMACSS